MSEGRQKPGVAERIALARLPADALEREVAALRNLRRDQHAVQHGGLAAGVLCRVGSESLAGVETLDAGAVVHIGWRHGPCLRETPQALPIKTADQRSSFRTTSAILPMCSLDSMRACASAAFASGKVLKITGLTLPAESSGQTFSLSSPAIAALSATGRGRSVEPVRVRRLRITGSTLSSTLGPRRKAMLTCRPSIAMILMLRGI